MRDYGLDILRVFGILIIIMAHADPPWLLDQVRNFGTPLLIVVSGMTHAHIFATRDFIARTYLVNRLRRLIVPAWIFLTVFFGAFLVADVVLGKEFPFEPSTVLTTYTFYGGIGYVWIFKVYIVLALLTPISLRLASSLKANKVWLSCLLATLLAHEIILGMVRVDVAPDWVEFFDTMVFVLVPYAVLYLYGMRLQSLSHGSVALIGIAFFVVFVVIAVTQSSDAGNFVPTQSAKYPPRIYYLSYAIAAVNLVYLAFAHLKLGRTAEKPVVWLSSNALWIYLWHILAIFLWGYLVGDRGAHYGWWLLKTVALVSFGILVTSAQFLVVHRFLIDSRYAAVRAVGRLLV